MVVPWKSSSTTCSAVGGGGGRSWAARGLAAANAARSESERGAGRRMGSSRGEDYTEDAYQWGLGAGAPAGSTDRIRSISRAWIGRSFLTTSLLRSEAY